MTKAEYQLLREYKKLSPEAQGEVFEYTKWLRDVEARQRLKGPTSGTQVVPYFVRA